jgi:hypothetical protein
LHAKLDVMTDQIPGVKTYSLAEVVGMVLPPDTKNGVRWLASRLTASAEYRVGRTWRMTRGERGRGDCRARSAATHRGQPTHRESHIYNASSKTGVAGRSGLADVIRMLPRERAAT